MRRAAGRSWAVAVALVWAYVGLAACANGQDDDEPREAEPTMSQSPSSQSPPSQSPPSQSPPSPPGPSRVVRDAVADLAQRRGVDPAEITVVSQDEVTWRDGSLGCAQPGTSYTQALVDGSRIVLNVAGKDYEYHASSRGRVFLCERPTQ